MKKTIITSLILLCCLLSLTAKTHLSVKLLSSFPDPIGDASAHGVLYGATDSIIIMVKSTSDSLPNRIFCSDFKGNQVDNIKLPVDSISMASYGIYYLPESKLLTYSDSDIYLNYVKPDGQEAGIRKFTGEIISLFIKVLEYQGKQYLLSWNPYEAFDRKNMVTSSTTLYQAQGDTLLPFRKRVFENDFKFTLSGKASRPGTMNFGFLLDSNLDHNMVLVDETEKAYKVTFSTPDSVYAFQFRHGKRQKMYRLNAGLDFLSLTIFNPEGKVTNNSGIYDLHGKLICSMQKFLKLIGEGYIFDIINNYVLVHNGPAKLIQVYEVKINNWKL